MVIDWQEAKEETDAWQAHYNESTEMHNRSGLRSERSDLEPMLDLVVPSLLKSKGPNNVSVTKGPLQTGLVSMYMHIAYAQIHQKKSARKVRI
jgi:hypothetical protein